MFALAFRNGPKTNPTALESFGTWLIETRIVTDYPHGGVVIGDKLYHSTLSGGVHVEDYHPERWVLVDLSTGDEELDAKLEAQALARFKQVEGAKYDWFSEVAFLGIPARDASRFYCYELQMWVAFGIITKRRVTPEVVLMEYVKYKGLAKGAFANL